MSHLILKKLPNGKYKIYNKKEKKFEGEEMEDEEKAEKVTEKRDEKEDKEIDEKEDMKGYYEKDRHMGKGGGMAKTMHEFKEGELHSGSKKGPVVKSRKQAIAIGMNSKK